MPRMSYTKRADGRLQTRIYCGVVDGKPRYKYVYARSLKELEQKTNELKAMQHKGIDLSCEKDTFGEWLQLWLKSKCTEVCDKWYRCLKSSSEKLKPFNNEKITKLKPYMLKELLANMAEEGYSAKSLKTVKDIAAGVLQLAVEERVIDYNIFSNVKVPKAHQQTTANIHSDLPKQERRALTDEEQRWIIDTPHRAQTAAMIMMFAGLRRGELIPLLWTDIDLNAGTISVTKSVERVGGTLCVKNGGKTKSASRTVYIPQILIDYLRKQEHTALFVCTNTANHMHSETSWTRMWDSYLKTLNQKYGMADQAADSNKKYSIPRFTPHWLRHTFITMMYLSGVDVLTAKEQAGHSDIQTTLAIYTHLNEQHKNKNIKKLNEYIKNIG